MAKILIVEDDPLIGRMYQQAFVFEGYEVKVAVDGEAGIKELEKEKPTIVLCDVMMPKKNGLDVLKEIKANPDTRDIPVIMLTNLSEFKDAEIALSLGAVKYIVKSEHKPKDIVDMVKEILAGYTRNEVPTAASN